VFDLDAYLARIGHTGPRTTTLQTLVAIATQHPRRIVYENIDPLLGRAPSLDLARLQDKLVARGRGGYCYEQNLLLREALLALGFEVTALSARVVWRRPADLPLRPRTHMLLQVRVPGEAQPWLVDVGFGGHMLDAPLRLEPGLEQRTHHARLRVMRDGEVHVVEAMMPGGWWPMYRFTLEPHLPADYEPLNWFTATHPGSIFCHNLLLERLTPTLRVSLLNDRLLLREPGLPPSMRRLGTPGELGDNLASRFDMTLPAETVARLFDRIPKGLDEFYLPPG
jgi:N-hydroxyarylamine O-acetyltransferase